jgi:hypothetical protein
MGNGVLSLREPLVVTAELDVACVDTVALAVTAGLDASCNDAITLGVEFTDALVVKSDGPTAAGVGLGEVDGSVGVGRSEIL